MRLFAPLADDHPMVKDDTRCPFCGDTFKPMQRTTLMPIRTSVEGGRCEALPVHATCAYRGLVSNQGIIIRIMDGDGSPYPILTNKGQFKEDEIECFAQWEETP